MPATKPLLVVVAGPTAVGKTATTIALARHFGTDIISADARQFYKELNIGTAKPTLQELAQAPHHFINNLSIQQPLNAGQFEVQALHLLQELFQQHPMVLVAGGSGLYINALVRGFDAMPAVPAAVRQALNEQFAAGGLAPLLQELQAADPAYFKVVDRANHTRVIRALEVVRATGRPYSSFRQQQAHPRPFRVLQLALNRPREELYARIDARMDAMVAQGLFEEAQSLYPHRHQQALQTVGYTEVFGFIEGQYDREEAIRLLKRNSRRYAKRQLTWFRKDPAYHWFHPDQGKEIIALIEKK